VLAGVALAFAAAAADLSAPNMNVVSPTLVTAGQPAAAALSSLGTQGFGAVIYFLPPTASGIVKDEAEILSRQGIAFVSLKIDFERPTERDYDAFAAAMAAQAGKKVLVHCQINLQASSMVFLHRVIVGKEDPDTAYQPVARLWSPPAAWKRFMAGTLRSHGVSFDPY
jgi:protein tyrosine phosphatase (PTP) superfamily phosphohydrolase (DUF442 family)